MNRVLVPILLFSLLLDWPQLAACAQGDAAVTQNKAQFAQNLREGVSAALGGSQVFDTQSVRWVLLVDTSQYQASAPVADAESQVLEELFQQTIRQGDHVSVLPFQLRPASPTLWDQPVAHYENLRPDLPETTREEGHQGGRDIEAAVKDALTRLKGAGEAGKAVLLVLSAARFSEVPTGEPHYALTTEHDPSLTAELAALHSSPTISLVSVPTAQKGGEKAIDLYLRAYIPHPLAGIGLRPKPPTPPNNGGRGSSKPHAYLPLERWLLIGLVILAIAALLGFLIKKTRGKKLPSIRPLLVLESTNLRFPESGRIEVYGNNLSASTPGTAQEPARISLENPDLPDAAQGPLFTLLVDKWKGVVIMPNLYTAVPAELPIDRETSVHLSPSEGVDGFPVRIPLTVRRQ